MTITDEWLECFGQDIRDGKDLSLSVFWRLALHTLPDGVDGRDHRIVAALEEIKRQCDLRAERSKVS